MSDRTSTARSERLILVLAVALCGACASAPARRSRAPGAPSLASINADLRMVGSETTWVVLHTGFELVARAKADIPVLESPLDDEARTFRRLFNADPMDVIITVRHPTSAGYGLQSAAPLPEGTVGTVVEIALADPPAARGAQDDSRSGGRGRGGRMGGRQGGRDDSRAPGGDADAGRVASAVSAATAKVVRAWLSAHATAVTGQPAPPTVRSGDNDDARIASWIEDGIPALLSGIQRETQLTSQLGTHTDSLFPLRTFLTMARPPFAYAPSAVAPSGGGSMGGGAPGGRGGMGGRGGVGGRGGAYPGRESARAQPALQGGALFEAQSALLARYLVTREGYPFLGALVDAQVRGTPVGDVLRTAKMIPYDLERVDDEWRRWLADRAGRPGY